MSESVVRTFQMSRAVEWVAETDKFQFDPKAKAPWLQKVCFWLLKLLGAHAKFAQEHIKRVDIDLNKLVDALMRNRADVEMLYHKRAKYLVVGADKFEDLVTSPEVQASYMMFEVPLHFNARAGYNGRPMPQMFAGLQVVVVPWIDGMFVLPELDR
jgi:hypothetical protein